MDLKAKAINLGASDFGISNVKNKRYFVIYNGKRINFGSKSGKTYIDHKDDKKKDAWYARHNKIINKAGEKVINKKDSPSYWSANLLWI
jgi:hypothetical protein